jgi:hypothetical protein
LHHWASLHENFITDAFSHVLKRLLNDDERAGIEVLQFLTNERFPPVGITTPIIVRTQVTLARGRPDIVISRLNHLVYVETKVESGLGDRQLERYLEQLEESTLPDATTLVVLSRYPVKVPAPIKKRVISKRWYQVAHVLTDILKREAIKNPVNKFLIEQLIGFFEARNITMGQVGAEMLVGLKAFDSLLSMVSEAILSQKMTTKDTFGRAWSGYYFDKPKKDFFFGVWHDRSNVLVFETHKFPVVNDADRRLGFGRMKSASYAPNKKAWVNELVLDCEEVNFFALTRAEQLHRVELFLAESLKAVRTVKEN